MTIRRRHLLALTGAAGLAPLAGARAQTRWQMATPYPDGNFHTRNIRTFLEEIQAARLIDTERDSELANLGRAVQRKKLAKSIGKAIAAKDRALLHLDAVRTSRRDARGAYVVPRRRRGTGRERRAARSSLSLIHI